MIINFNPQYNSSAFITSRDYLIIDTYTYILSIIAILNLYHICTRFRLNH